MSFNFYQTISKKCYHDENNDMCYEEKEVTSNGKITNVRFVKYSPENEIEEFLGTDEWDGGDFNLQESIKRAVKNAGKSIETTSFSETIPFIKPFSTESLLKIGDRVIFNTKDKNKLVIPAKRKEAFLLDENLHKTILIKYSEAVPNINNIYTLCLFNKEDNLALIANTYNYFLVPFDTLKRL